MPQTPATGVFLSYSHDDSATVVRLRQQLERLNIPVKVDFTSMAPGQNIQDFILSAIRSTHATIWVVSEDSLSSGWVGVEMITSLSNAELWREHALIACYLDDDFFDEGFRLRQHEKISARIAELEATSRRHAEAGIDTDDLDAGKSRLYELRNNLGKLLKHLRGSLCLDLRSGAFEESVRRLGARLEPLVAVRQTQGTTSPPPASSTLPPSSRGRSRWVVRRWYVTLGGVAIAAALGAWAIRGKDPVDACVETMFKRTGVTANRDQVEFAANVAKTGRLNLNTNDELRASTHILESCRAQHVKVSTPLLLTFKARVAVKAAHGAVLQDRVRISSRTGVSCTTRQGSCELALENVRSTDKLVVSADVEGVRDKEVQVASLLTGDLTFEMPPTLKDVVVTVSDCNGKRLKGKVRLEGASIQKRGCINSSDASCRSAMLDDGEATFRYDPTLFRKGTLHYYVPDGGPIESHEMTEVSGALAITSPKSCGVVPRGPRQCSVNVGLTLQNESRRALARGATAQVRFQIKSNRVSFLAAPADVTRQLNGKFLATPDCTGSFSVP